MASQVVAPPTKSCSVSVWSWPPPPPPSVRHRATGVQKAQAPHLRVGREGDRTLPIPGGSQQGPKPSRGSRKGNTIPEGAEVGALRRGPSFSLRWGWAALEAFTVLDLCHRSPG